VRLSEIYVARYASIDPYPAVLKAGKRLCLADAFWIQVYSVNRRFLRSAAVEIQFAEVAAPEFYLPAERETLLKLPENFTGRFVRWIVLQITSSEFQSYCW
jgi:hypothetical protein